MIDLAYARQSVSNALVPAQAALSCVHLTRKGNARHRIGTCKKKGHTRTLSRCLLRRGDLGIGKNLFFTDLLTTVDNTRASEVLGLSYAKAGLA